MNRLLFIDIEEADIYTYVFERGKGTYKVSQVKKYPRGEKHRFSLGELPHDIDTAYISLPLSSLNFRVIDVPFSHKDKIREVLPFELDGMILGGSDQVVYDTVIIGSPGSTNQVLAVYVDKPLIRDILDNCRSHTIDPEYITSIELRSMGKDFSLEQLLAPVSVDEQDRISLALEEIKAPTINLRRGEFAYTRSLEETKKSLKVTAILAILIMALLSAGLVFKIVSTKAEIGSIKKDLRKNYLELFPEEKHIVNEIHQLKSHMKELKQKEEVLVGVSPLTLLLKLSRIDNQHARFHEISIQNESITFKGEAPSLRDIQNIKVELERFFDDVSIADSKASASGSMIFSITAKEKKA